MRRVERRSTVTRLCVRFGGVLLTLLLGTALAQVEVPPLRAPVTDLTQTLTAEQITALDLRLREFERRRGSQIAILLVPTTQPETIEQYAIRVAETWQLGRRGVDDGVLLLVATEDRAVRIEVGYGLEGALPDVMANRIIQQVIVPRFREGDYFGGLSAALDRIIALLEGEPLPASERRDRSVGDELGALLPLLFVIVFVGGALLRTFFGSFGSATVTGAMSGALVWLFTRALPIAIAAAIIMFVIGLFGGRGGGGSWVSRGGWGGFGGWGGYSAGRGGWSGGGGWRGGGGGFGGGGASGRW